MKTITLDEAFLILETCSAVVWDEEHHFLTYPSLSQLTDEPDNEWLYLQAADEKGYEYSVKFAQGPNESVKVVGSSLFLVDTEGDEIQVNALVPLQVERPPLRSSE